MKLSNKAYDILKWIALIGLPAALTFYGVVGVTFQIPYTKEILTVGSAFDSMLGAMLGISTSKYRKGE